MSKSNVVMMNRPPLPDMSLRLTEEQMAAMRAKPIVRQDSLAPMDPAAKAPRPNQPVAIETSVNKSLALAGRSNFFEMCQPLLWGDELETQRQEFGEMLRGAVESFLPETTFDLYLLKAIVAAQWRLNRLLEIQANIFASRAEHQQMVPAKFGLPKATVDALSVDEQIDSAQANVRRAIQTYQATRGK